MRNGHHLPVPPVRFAHAPGARLAYQVFGSGPNLVAIPPMAQHIEMAWEWPDIRVMLERFGSFSRYLHFDKRGTGASDRRSRIPGIDERVEDLRAVMDDAGVDQAHLFACSEGGPMAILFAATYPDRVLSITFSGSAASQFPSDMTDEQREERLASHRRYASKWGTSESPVAAGFAPSLAQNAAFRDWHQRYERSAADRDSLVELLDLSLEMDVRELLPALEVPTLVIHRTGDKVIAVELGRELAEQIPGARLFEQKGADHFQYAGDVDGWMEEVERFVTGTVTSRPARPFAARVHISVLGRFAVTRDGAEIPVSEWGSRLARQICKRLVLARGWPVGREELMDMCWPGEAEMAKLGARLSVQLSAVRRVLGGGVIADRDAVRLDLNQVETDLEELFAATTDEEIVNAYTGELLPEDRYDDWASPMRDEARARFLSAGHRIGGETRDIDRARWLARRLLEADPYDEPAHRLLVRTLLDADEPREAERAHENWASAMAELDVHVAPFDDFRSGWRETSPAQGI